ncbi:glycoside hydrolase family 128 protein [Atractiella rhizophila]|nr:glycoside hydrolase family 128 protein [Atractiella rhizophila]
MSLFTFIFAVLSFTSTFSFASSHDTFRMDKRATFITGKKGLGFNDVKLTKGFNKTVAWVYNWGQTHEGTLNSGVEYIPMLWSDAATFTSTWDKNVKAAIKAGSTHLLAFNEPDLNTQANMSPTQAAKSYKKYFNPYKQQIKLVSPAITNGAPPAMGTGWMDEFLSLCKGCHIDAIAVHIYDSATNIAYFKAYLTDLQKKYAPRKIWVTEFGASGTKKQEQDFLKEMLPWLTKQSGIERYAYFGDFAGMLVEADGSLNTRGRTYAKFGN